MLRKRTIWILAGIGAAATIGAVVLTAGSAVVTDVARFEIRNLFVVNEDCTAIGLAENGGEALDEAQLHEQLDQADTYYFNPMVKAGLAAGITDPEEMAIWILDDIFPGCKGDWPPSSFFHFSKQVIWFGMRTHVTNRMEALS